MWKTITDNPKTSLAGLGTIAAALLAAFHLVDAQQATAIGTAFTAMGLLLSADAK